MRSITHALVSAGVLVLLVLSLAMPGTSVVHAAAPFESTTKGKIVLTCDGVRVSDHVVETEATARAINYALEHAGKASCSLTPPAKAIAIDIPLTAAPPAPTPAPAPQLPPSPPGALDIRWTPPLQYTDNSPLTDLAGFRIHYGPAADALSNVAQVPDPGTLGYRLSGLTAGTWYFAVTAYAKSGKVSAPSNVASRVVL